MTQSKAPGSVVVGARIPHEAREAFCRLYGQNGPSKGLSSVIDLVLASGCRDLDELAGRLSLAPPQRCEDGETKSRLRLVVSDAGDRNVDPPEDD
ncbi:MAG: hypothetical protein AAF371_12595 [Pseudomonadota bacterium]